MSASELAPLPSQVTAEDCGDELTAPEWCELLDIAPQSFRERCVVTHQVRRGSRVSNLYKFADLPADYRAALEALRAQHRASTYRSLLQMGRVETKVWTPQKSFMEYGPKIRDKALLRKQFFASYYAALNKGGTVDQAYARAAAEFPDLARKGMSRRSFYEWKQRIEERGGEFARIEAFCSEHEVAHPGARIHVPEELVSVLKDRATRCGEWNAAVRSVLMDWRAGMEVPGVGRAVEAGQEFPFSVRTLEKFIPSKAARLVGSKGRARAKAQGFLPATAISSEHLRLRERIVFDDKRLDIVAKDDQTGRLVELVLYIAMDESTRQIIGYILREVGAIRQMDVQALLAFVLGRACFAGRTAGYPTTLKFERGTVAISDEFQKLLEGLFPGELIISRTTMIGGKNGPGQYSQKASGNFMGKGKLEAFMGALDHYLLHVPGQRGNIYQNTPAMLGDLLATPEKMASKNYRPTGSMIEEAVLCAQTARALGFVNGTQDGQLPAAIDAEKSTGVKGPLVYVSEVNSAIQQAIAWWNAERGHRREGFERIALIDPDGTRRAVTESGDDKAARLRRELTQQGRSLQRISEADIVAFLRKVVRVTVRPNGAQVTINKIKRTYWHPDSVAVDAAQQSTLGEKVYLALYNPEDPVCLYLLSNCPSHVPPSADELPANEQPVFFEALPLLSAPEINDTAGLIARAEQIQRNHSKVILEHNLNILPFVAEETQRRERNTEITEPLRAAVTTIREEHAAARDASPLGESLAKADESGDGMPTRADQRASARPYLGTADDYRAALESDR